VFHLRWRLWMAQSSVVITKDRALAGNLRCRKMEKSRHLTVCRETIEMRARPTLNIAASYNNLTADNLINVAVWVCGRIDLEESK